MPSQPAEPASAEDSRLLQQLQHGHPDERAAAFRMLVDQYGEPLYRTACLHLSDPTAADDAAQETLIAAWDASGRRQIRTAVKAWLYGTLTNQCRRLRRTLARRRTHEQAAGELRVRQTGDPPARAEQEASRCRVQGVILDLTDALRDVMVLRFYQGLTVEQTAAALHIPAATVRSRTHAAKKLVSQRMGLEPDEA